MNENRGTRPTMGKKFLLKIKQVIPVGSAISILTNAFALRRIPTFSNTTRFVGPPTESMKYKHASVSNMLDRILVYIAFFYCILIHKSNAVFLIRKSLMGSKKQ